MVKLTKKDKEAIKRAQEIEAQLRASANTASKLVDAWLPPTEKEEEPTIKRAKEIFKGRPARLGIGATKQHSVLSSDELRIKRRLQLKKTIKEDDCTKDNNQDDEGSRSSMLQNNSVTETKTTKRTRTTEYLDSILNKRPRKR